LLKSLHIWVPWGAEIGSWVKFLHHLAKEASGLRVIELVWDAKADFPWQLERGDKERALGNSLLFVRALGQIRGLEEVVIRGYYAKRWQAYLQGRMCVQVQAKCGHCLELRERDVNDKLKRELNKKELQLFRKYQGGTEDLIPKGEYGRRKDELARELKLYISYPPRSLFFPFDRHIFSEMIMPALTPQLFSVAVASTSDT
jgi:hypothetical protein